MTLRYECFSAGLMAGEIPAITGMLAFLRPLPTSTPDKDIEILVLRHQLNILRRQVNKPRLTPPGRAFLAALLHRTPRLTLRTFHLIVSPTPSCAGGGATGPPHRDEQSTQRITR
jgi:hypothetical protein